MRVLACGQVPNVGGWFWGGPNGIYLYSAEFFVETALITLTGGATPPGGAFQFTFTNTSGVNFGALVATNPALPLSTWLVVGGVSEIGPGQYHYIDLQAANSPQRFYRIRLD